MQNQLQEIQQEQTLENENVRIKYTKSPGCKVHLEVSVLPLAIQAAYEKAFKAVKKEVSLPGFRKGKVPDEVVTKNYASHVEREWKDLCLRTAFIEAISLAKLQPLSKNSIKRSFLKSCSKESGAEAIFDYECEPQIPSIDLKAIETKLEAQKSITNEDLDWEIKKQRVRHATFEEVQERAVQEGDYVELDLDVIENPAHNVFTGRLFCVSKEEMPKWAYELALGMQLNESKESKIAPNEHSDEQCTEKHEHTDACSHGSVEAKLCRITCTAIKRAILPEVDEEFAKKFGFNTAEELKEKIKEMLQRDADLVAKEQTRSKLAFELLQKYPVDLPSSLVEAEIGARFRYVKKLADQERGSLPASADDDQELKAMVASEVHNFFSCMYLLNTIARQLQISVTQEELVEEITFETQALAPHQRLVYPGIDPNEARNRMFMRVMMRKALDYLIEQSTAK